MKRVKMKTTIAGPKFTASAGQEILIDDEQADVLVAGNYAELVAVAPAPKEEKAAAPKEEPESAAVDQPETAVIPPPRRRKTNK